MRLLAVVNPWCCRRQLLIIKGGILHRACNTTFVSMKCATISICKLLILSQFLWRWDWPTCWPVLHSELPNR